MDERDFAVIVGNLVHLKNALNTQYKNSRLVTARVVVARRLFYFSSLFMRLNLSC